MVSWMGLGDRPDQFDARSMGEGVGLGEKSMITWADKVAFVGMVVKVMNSSHSNFKCKVKVGVPCGICSYGYGDTMDKAIESAAVGLYMDWCAIERKITEREWERMSHT